VIQDGKARWIERETAQGLIKELLDNLRQRNRKAFLDSCTVKTGGRRQLRIDGKHALAATAAQKRRVRAFLVKFSRQQPKPKFFRVLDVARRIAGTGSLGVERYVLLVEGKGSPDKNYLLDLKQALPSALSSKAKVKQPRWDNEAQRIVTVQTRVQAISIAFLRPVVFAGTSYVLRGLQPSEDRVALNGPKGNIARRDHLIRALGHLVAWGQLRSGGRQGSASADELASFWQKRSRPKKLLGFAQECAKRTQSQWEEYGRAIKKG
jgi:uncharacterized protein (DUF2252 family)